MAVTSGGSKYFLTPAGGYQTMKKVSISRNSNGTVLAVLMCTLVLSPGAVGAAEVPIGRAQAVNANVLGTTTVLADTGTLVHETDARHNSLTEGSVAAPITGELLNADVLHATTTAGVDQVDSTASLADLAVSVVDILLGEIINVSAEFVRSEARAVSGGAVSGGAMIDGLFINGLLTVVTGEVNQIIPLVGGQVIINEHESIPGGVRVNALHIVIDGVADLIIASSTAGLQ